MTAITAEYIDHMGDDLSVVRAAKVSFANDDSVGETYTDYGIDEHGVYEEVRRGISVKEGGLIRYLAKHNHWTPFAHTSITFRCSAPVPIRTQAFKHKAGFVENEESRRYIKSTPELYAPEVWRSAPPEGGAKQGSGGEFFGKVRLYDPWDDGVYDYTPDLLYRQTALRALTVYDAMVKAGVCPEQARFVLPQGCIVNWYWTGSLAAFARFYSQRTDPHAQLEIQGLARIIGEKLAELYPVSWKELTLCPLPSKPARNALAPPPVLSVAERRLMSAER